MQKLVLIISSVQNKVLIISFSKQFFIWWYYMNTKRAKFWFKKSASKWCYAIIVKTKCYTSIVWIWKKSVVIQRAEVSLTVYEFGKRKKKRDFISCSCRRVALHWWPVCASPARWRQVQSSLPSHFQTLPFSLPLRLLPLQWHHKQRRRAAATAHGYLGRLAPLSARPSTLATLSDTPLVRSLYHPSHPPLSCPLSPKSNLFLTLLLLPKKWPPEPWQRRRMLHYLQRSPRSTSASWCLGSVCFIISSLREYFLAPLRKETLTAVILWMILACDAAGWAIF